MVFDPRTLSWTCHICEEERPDEKISVCKKTGYIYDTPVQQNIRYCNDSPPCEAIAKEKFHFPGIYPSPRTPPASVVGRERPTPNPSIEEPVEGS